MAGAKHTIVVAGDVTIGSRGSDVPSGAHERVVRVGVTGHRSFDDADEIAARVRRGLRDLLALAGATLVARGDSTDAYDDLHVFGVLEHVCTADRLLCGIHEILARAIHADYVVGRRRAGLTDADDPALVDWERLPETLRNSNLGQADHIVRRLAAIGCDIAPLADWNAQPLEFSADEVELMAAMEHDRWVQERLDSGWTYAPGAKDIERKTSPLLVPWKDVADDKREYDRRTVRDLPQFLADVGLQVARRPAAAPLPSPSSTPAT